MIGAHASFQTQADVYTEYVKDYVNAETPKDESDKVFLQDLSNRIDPKFGLTWGTGCDWSDNKCSGELTDPKARNVLPCSAATRQKSEWDCVGNLNARKKWEKTPSNAEAKRIDELVKKYLTSPECRLRDPQENKKIRCDEVSGKLVAVYFSKDTIEIGFAWYCAMSGMLFGVMGSMLSLSQWKTCRLATAARKHAGGHMLKLNTVVPHAGKSH